MFVAITNSPRRAAWGSTTAIAELLGAEPSGAPEAELWFGGHPASPALFVEPETAGGFRTVADWAAAHGQRLDPTGTAQDSSRGAERWLPFLLKVLAAAKPLSLQAHPTAAQARAGWVRENAAGVPVDAPHRNYPDPHPKPELIVALSETFDALAGFRPVAETSQLLAELGAGEAVDRLGDLPAFVAWLLTRGEGVAELVELVSSHEFADDATRRLVRSLADDYPGDPGIVLALALNRVTLTRGEALFVPAGTIHAYVEGLGIELMTASDNVLRGGLTVKNIDVPELLEVLDATPGPVPRLEPDTVSGSHRTYHAAGTAPRLDWVTGVATLAPDGPAIALCTEGEFALDGATSSATVARGGATLITADEWPLAVTGAGSLFVASAASGGPQGAPARAD